MAMAAKAVRCVLGLSGDVLYPHHRVELLHNLRLLVKPNYLCRYSDIKAFQLKEYLV